MLDRPNNENYSISNGILNFVEIDNQRINLNQIPLCVRNAPFSPSDNSRFDFTETGHLSQDFLFLYEKMTIKASHSQAKASQTANNFQKSKTENCLFSRLKVYRLMMDDGNDSVLLSTFSDNQFDTEIVEIYSERISEEQVVFVTVHRFYSKFWELLYNPRKESFEWKNTRTVRRSGKGDFLGQRMEVLEMRDRKVSGFEVFTVLRGEMGGNLDIWEIIGEV